MVNLFKIDNYRTCTKEERYEFDTYAAICKTDISDIDIFWTKDLDPERGATGQFSKLTHKQIYIYDDPLMIKEYMSTALHELDHLRVCEWCCNTFGGVIGVFVFAVISSRALAWMYLEPRAEKVERKAEVALCLNYGNVD